MCMYTYIILSGSYVHPHFNYFTKLFLVRIPSYIAKLKTPLKTIGSDETFTTLLSRLGVAILSPSSN